MLMAYEAPNSQAFVAETSEAIAEAPDYAHLLETYGLGPQEMDQTVSFGNYTGTVAAMFTDERCPVGKMVADTYRAEGIDGVERKISGLQGLDGSFALTISEDTKSFHEGAVKRDELLKKPELTKEEPDFLEL